MCIWKVNVCLYLRKWNDCVLFAAKDYELRRDLVQLYEVLGEGQFGDVYKGVWTDKVYRHLSLKSDFFSNRVIFKYVTPSASMVLGKWR